MLRTLLPLLLVFMSCAELLKGTTLSEPEKKMSASDAFTKKREKLQTAKEAAESIGTPKQWAKGFARDIECERTANEMKSAYTADVPWQYLKACVAKGNFTQLEVLLANWTDELQSNLDAPMVLAQVIAKRGAHIDSDLVLIQKKRLQLFDLGAAMKQQKAFRGRTLVVAGRIEELKVLKNRTDLTLAELTIPSESSRGFATARMDHGLVETGQSMVLKVNNPDPFLQLDKTLLFLVRFDGTSNGEVGTEDESGATEKIARATMLAFYDL